MDLPSRKYLQTQKDRKNAEHWFCIFKLQLTKKKKKIFLSHNVFVINVELHRLDGWATVEFFVKILN